MPQIPPVKVISYDDNIYYVGDVKTFFTFDEDNNIGATLDAALWSALSSATLVLTDPNGNSIPIAGTQVGSGIFKAQTLTGTFSTPGTWYRRWQLSDGSTPEGWGAVEFFVRSV